MEEELIQIPSIRFSYGNATDLGEIRWRPSFAEVEPRFKTQIWLLANIEAARRFPSEEIKPVAAASVCRVQTRNANNPLPRSR